MSMEKNVVLKVSYFMTSDEMTDEEYENQDEQEFEVTEQMIYDLVSEKVRTKQDETICTDNFYCSRP